MKYEIVDLWGNVTTVAEGDPVSGEVKVNDDEYYFVGCPCEDCVRVRSITGGSL